MNSLRHDPDDIRQASRVAAFTGVMLFWAIVFVPVYIAVGGMECAVVLLAGCVIALINLVGLQRGVPTRTCGNLLCAIAFAVYTGLSYYCGGRWAPSIVWYVSIPVVSMVVCGAGWAGLWTAFSVLAIGIFTLLDNYGVVLPTVVGSSDLVILHTLGLTGLLLCCYVLAYVITRFERHSRDVLRQANRWLQMESTSDALTKIANRRCFDQVLEHEWNRHRRDSLPLTIVLIDLDFFKEFNDLRGHLAGDNVLRLIASAIQAGVHRRDDLVARFGGEEFVVILPNTSDRYVREIVERIREQVAELNILHPRSQVSHKVTISLGTATTVPGHICNHLDLLRKADEALYSAKAAGRDRVVYAAEMARGHRLSVAEISLDDQQPESDRQLDQAETPDAATVPCGHYDEACG